MHDPKVLLWSPWGSRLVEVWHVEPGGADSGTHCPYETMRWHPQHWQVKVMPLVRLQRRLTRCDRCGRRMNTAARFGLQGTDRVWHDECSRLGQMERDELLLVELLDRFVSLVGDVEDEASFRSLVVRPERRDQFLLWYQGWRRLDRYRAQGPRWRAPNEHLTEVSDG